MVPRIAKLLLVFCSFVISLASFQPTYSQEPASNEVWRIRIVWGGGKARSYQGTLRFEQATVKHFYSLGVKPSSVLDILPQGPNQFRLDCDNATQFAGMDLEVQGGPQSRIHFEWNGGGSKSAERMSWTFADIEKENKHADLDEQGNRVFLDRVPADRISVDVARPHMLYAPRERMEFRVKPFRTGLPAGSAYLRATLIEEESERVIHEETFTTTIDDQGSAPSQTIAWEAPEQNGAYRWQLQLEPKLRFGTLLTSQKSISRQVQWVVVGKNSVAKDVLAAEPSPWEWTQRLDLFAASTTSRPLFKRLGGSTALSASSSSPLASRTLQGATALVLDCEQWRSLPLENLEVGRPYSILVRAPRDQPMQCLVSIVDSDRESNGDPISIDGGMTIVANETVQDGWAEHRFVFWPKSKFSQLLLYNPSSEWKATIASAELFRGPLHLPGMTPPERSLMQPRMVALKTDLATLMQTFGGMPKDDAFPKRRMDDWSNLYLACERMAEYCRYAGYNTLVFPGAQEGSFLFPCQSIQANARLDQGMFFADGRDPMRKDILELVMRVMAREGVRVVVSLDLDAPLRELERWRSQNSGGSGQPIDQCLLTGETWHQGASGKRSSDRRYNPLHPEFQRLFKSFQNELLKRYGHHGNWAGVSFVLTPNSHFLFAGDRWGYDEHSIRDFAASMQLPVPTEVEARRDLLQGRTKTQWLTWRAEKLQSWFESVQQQLQADGTGRKLILDTASLFESAPSSQASLTPTQFLNQPTELLTAYGLGSPSTQTTSAILLRGAVEQPLLTIVDRQWSSITANHVDVTQMLRSRWSGFSLDQPPVGVRVTGVPKASGADNTNAMHWLMARLESHGDYAKKQMTRRLADEDASTIFHAGPLFGQEERTRGLRNAFAELPLAKMSDIPATGGEAGTNVLVRSCVQGDRTYFCILNDAPWAETVQCEWSHAPNASIQWLTSPREGLLADSSPLPSQIELEPYSMQAWQVTGEPMQIVKWNHAALPGVRERLTASLEQLSIYLNRTATHQTSYVLENEGFEADADANGQIPGWMASILPSTNIRLDDSVSHSGSRSLCIENRGKQGSAWIQSPAFAPPITGRLSLECYLLTDPGLLVPEVEANLTCRRRDGSKYNLVYPIVLTATAEPKTVDPTGLTANKAKWYYCSLPVLKDVSPEDLSELQISLDVKTRGTVWIDDLRINDLFLTDEERRRMRADLFLATREMDRGNFAMSQRLLESYLAEYLFHFAWEDTELVEPDRAVPSTRLKDDQGKLVGTSKSDVRDSDSQQLVTESSGRPANEKDRPWLKRVREGLRRSRNAR